MLVQILSLQNHFGPLRWGPSSLQALIIPLFRLLLIEVRHRLLNHLGR